MSSQGPNNGSAFSSVPAAGVIWTHPENAQFSDDIYAACPLAGFELTDLLTCTGYGFTIPTESVINGIVVEIEHVQIGGGVVRDSTVSLVQGGVVAGDNKAAAGDWPLVDTFSTYGSPTDLWGLVWDAASINSVNFGAILKAINFSLAAVSANVDNIRITVYYTSAVVPPTPTPSAAIHSRVSSTRLSRHLGYEVRPLYAFNCPEDFVGMYNSRLIEDEFDGRPLYALVPCTPQGSSSSSSNSSRSLAMGSSSSGVTLLGGKVGSSGSSSGGIGTPYLGRLLQVGVAGRELYAVENPCCPPKSFSSLSSSSQSLPSRSSSSASASSLSASSASKSSSSKSSSSSSASSESKSSASASSSSSSHSSSSSASSSKSSSSRSSASSSAPSSSAPPRSISSQSVISRSSSGISASISSASSQSVNLVGKGICGCPDGLPSSMVAALVSATCPALNINVTINYNGVQWVGVNGNVEVRLIPGGAPCSVTITLTEGANSCATTIAGVVDCANRKVTGTGNMIGTCSCNGNSVSYLIM